MEDESIEVLLIEDNPDDAELIRRKLDRSTSGHFKVTSVKSLKDGLEHLAQNTFDLVLSDLGLPDSHGLDTVTKIMCDAPHIPVVVLSGFDDEETAIKAVQSGAQDYMVKGQLDGSQIERSLSYAIERARLQRELEQYTQEIWKIQTNLLKILDKNADAIIVVSENRQILFANPAAESLLGRKKKDLLNTPFSFPLNGGKTSEIEIKLPGREKTIAEMSVVEIDWEGKPAYLASLHNITERKRSEEALRESEEKFSKAFRSSPEVIVITNLKDGTMLEVNDTFLRLTGYSPEEIVDKKATEVGIWAEPEDRAEMVKTLLEKGVVSNQEYTFRMKSGEIRTWLFSAEIINIGSEPCILSVTTDITERKKAEEALRFSDAAFKSIHESVIATDTEYIITHWNDISEQIYGIKASKAIGKKLTDIIEIVETYPGENAKRFKTLEANGFYQEEQLHRTRHGEVWVDVSFQAIEGNNIRYGWVALTSAITQRKLAEEALKRSEEKYRELISTSIDGIVSMDQKMRVAIWNYGAERIFGYTEKEMLGQSVMKIIPERYQKVAEKRLTGSTGSHRNQSVNKLSVAAGLRKNGTEVPIELSISSRNSGENQIATAIIRDITERKEAEEAIKRAAQEWRTTFDSINELIAVIDRDYKIVRVNRSFAKAFKMKPEEILGKTCYELFHGTAEPWPACPLTKAINTKKPTIAEYFEPRLGIYLEETTSPVLNERGEVVYYVHVSRNITERKEAEEKLHKIDQMKSEFLSNVSHELRTPLQSISGFTKLILSGKVPDPTTQREFLQIVDGETQHLGNLINSLLDMSRLESGRFQINRRPIPIGDLITESLKGLHSLAREKNITLNEDIPPHLPEIEADGDRLRQVVINLLNNAIKFSEPSSSVSIKAEQHKEELLFQVSDHGIGMSEEVMQHLFERFYRAEGEQVRGGTGLGLYISKQIIEAHGGHIWAESKPGEGSTFSFTLPLNGKGGKDNGQENPGN
jgi:PAS domain S-box-containing protein